MSMLQFFRDYINDCELLQAEEGLFLVFQDFRFRKAKHGT